MFFKSTGVRKQLVTALCVYLGQILMGYTIAWSAPMIPKLQDPLSSPLVQQMTELQTSFLGSSIYLGGLSGPYITGYLSNVRGRRPCLLLGAAVSIIGYIILAGGSTLVMVYIGRTLTGLGSGMLNVMSVVYLGEIASTDMRGIFLTGIGIFITSGSLLVFSVGPFVPYSMTAYLGVCLASIYAVAIFWIPESPTFFALKGKEDAVRKVLEELGRINDIDKILLQKKEEDSLRDWRELFLLKGNRRALIITIVLNIFQNASGLIAVTFFATSIFGWAGSVIEPSVATIILGFTQLAGGLITPIFIERSGRRILLAISTAMCSISMIVLGVYFYLNHINHWAVQSLKWLPITTLVIFYVSYDSGLGIIPNAIAGEMFEPNVRSKGCAVVITISWLTGFMVTTAFGTLTTLVGAHIVFWLFALDCALALLYTIFFVPETKGKSLKEIQEMLNE